VSPQDSYPYLSGDAYRLRCDLDLTTPGNAVEKILDTISISDFSSIFVGGEKEGRLLLNLLEENKLFTNWSLFFHNQDVSPSVTFVEKILERAKKVYAQGWLGKHESVKALPSGLENRCKLRNGIPSDFSREIRKGIARDRKISVFLSFKESNNLGERGNLRSIFDSVKASYSPESPINPKKYRQALLNSQYVVSPPGNGPDCHRTWESIYLGAIPIVLRQSWPFEGDPLPVLVVDSWQDAVELISTGRTHEFDPRLNNPLSLWDRYLNDYF
jgi:hypothetical protein